MKRRDHFFGKILFLLLALFSLGGNYLFAGSLPEIREERSTSAEDIKVSPIFFWATEENGTPEISEAAEDHFLGGSSGRDQFLPKDVLSKSITQIPDYRRDIKKSISSLIFPTHFFL